MDVNGKKFLQASLIIGFMVLAAFGPKTLASSPSNAGQTVPTRAETRVLFLPLVPVFTEPPTPTPTATPTESPTEEPTTPSCLTHNSAYEDQLYAMINAIRADYGLAPLVVNYALEVSSGWHSDDMAINHFISHTGSDGSTFWQRAQAAGYTGSYGGEIIMMTDTPQHAIDWWMNDAPHRDMILSNTNDFGAGYANCGSGYFTVDFGHR
jgi:uncharacterized protein YkwD